MNELALFAGAGGGILGGQLLGWRTVCAVEWEPYPASVLMQRQNDGLLSPFPIWDDVRTFDGKPWRGIVDVVSGGFPCQDISVAGKGAGIEGKRSGMWSEMARIIGEVRPRHAFIENSPMLITRGLDSVLCDLAAMGYDSKWGIVSASHVGAPHKRERIWIVGNSNMYGHTSTKIRKSPIERSNTSSAREKQTGEFKRPSKQHAELADSSKINVQRIVTKKPDSEKRKGQKQGQAGPRSNENRWWKTEPNVGRVVDGVASRVDQLKAIGNGQVPQCAAEAWRILTS